MNEKYTYKKINSLAEMPIDFVKSCTAYYHAKIEKTAKRIFADKSKKIVMLAGPSSSGKTTTAKLLSQKLEKLGSKAYTVSLDDFYHPHSVGYPLDENGEPDYECVEALDIGLLHSSLGELIRNGKADLPVFDFMTGERINNAKSIELSENDVIIVEGLHALNPVITDTLDNENLYKIYVSVSSRVYDDNEEVLLSKRDLRFIRRMVRDFSFRSTSVEETFDIWERVMRGEDKYLFPFEYRADVRIDSFHPCESCVLAGKAIPLLDHIKDGEFSVKANELKEKLRLFKEINYSVLPADSLLREFTG